MVTGKTKIGKKTYYFNSKGQMVTGKVKIGKKTYTFNKSGVLTKIKK
jgi:glucan-binding YG repeat protein